MGYIYIIKNIVNDKVYIGQTVQTIQRRWEQHLYASRNFNTKLYNAMREIGVENFFIEILEKCDADNLDEREQYYIKCNDSFNNGYNSTNGGQFSKIMEPDWLNNMLEDYNNNMSYKNLAIKYNVSLNYIAMLITKNNYKREISYNNKNVSIQVIAYDKLFNPIKQFNTIKEAIQWINSSTEYNVSLYNGYTYIGAACKKGNIAYGLHWQAIEDLKLEDKIFRTKFDKEAYINGAKAYKDANTNYYIVDGALNFIKSYIIELNKIRTNIDKINKKDKKHNNTNRICVVCGKRETRCTSGRCIDCYNKQRRANIPDKETLELLVSKNSYEEIGRMYKVTGKAVRKWCESYNLISNKRKNSPGVNCVELGIHFDTFKDAAQYLIDNGYSNSMNVYSLAYSISKAKEHNKKKCSLHWN